MEVLDFDRINELCADRNDPTEGKEFPDVYGAYVKYPISRRVIKELVNTYMDYMKRGYERSGDNIEYVKSTLKYNKILVNPAQRNRDKKLEELLENET